MAGAPAAAGNPFALPHGPSGRPIVDYRGLDRHIHVLWINGSGLWAHTDITALTNAPLSAGDPMEYLKGSTQIVPFRAVDSHIQGAVYAGFGLEPETAERSGVAVRLALGWSR